MSDIILHQWEISPFCQKVARALKFKGIPYETINYNGILGAKVPLLTLYTTNFTEPLSYQGSAFLKLPKFP
ncbi:glutathione S-transferase N-terminal domain-containing protein, partial [Acinetobacter baumannii]|uniref:glutathione S-transferase N-terminal domain-containing protein n=1 Tax=Acinetobacter baumannii TaxID=470 RepID=UPI001D17567F